MRIHKFIGSVVLFLLTAVVTGCSGTSYSKTALRYGTSDLQGQLTRNDLSIGPRDEASASTTYLLFGLLSFGGDPEATAYNNLLAKMPDADEVAGVSTRFDFGGLPPLFWTGSATVYGKPVTIKPDTSRR